MKKVKTQEEKNTAAIKKTRRGIKIRKFARFVNSFKK